MFALVAAGLILAGSVHLDVAGRVLDALQAARRASGVAPFVRNTALDEVALDHARFVASLEQSERLAAEEKLGAGAQDLGVGYRRIRWHLEFNRGYRDPARAFVESWTGYEDAWKLARSEPFDQIGIATAIADDGWIVLVAVMIEEHRPPPEPIPDELEAATLASTNAWRSAQGLEPLESTAALDALARAHSRDMIDRKYFDHVAPDGDDVGDRARRAGLEYSRVGENVHRNRGTDDPAATAVKAWVDSPGHRELLLFPGFRQTGVGVAIDTDGTVYFTQVFFAPSAVEP